MIQLRKLSITLTGVIIKLNRKVPAKWSSEVCNFYIKYNGEVIRGSLPYYTGREVHSRNTVKIVAGKFNSVSNHYIFTFGWHRESHSAVLLLKISDLRD